MDKDVSCQIKIQQNACIPKQIVLVGATYICKVGIIDNKNQSFLPPFTFDEA